MISTHSRTSPLRPARSRVAREGFSLIEVAIALVIFVIGALAIIRIFPGALSVIGNNGNQQIARNLNRSALVNLKSEQTNAITKKSFSAAPYSTFNIRVNAADKTLSWNANNTNHTADFEDLGSSVIGVPRFNATLPSSDEIGTGANNSALSRYRGVQGEQAKVILLGSPAEKYVLTQFPISLAKINGATTDTILAPTISQEYVVENARINNLGAVTFTNATITDNAGATVRLDDTTSADANNRNTVPANSMIYVSYRYLNARGVWGIKDEALPIATAIQSPSIPATLAATTLTVNPPITTRGAIANYNAANPTTTGFVAEIIDVRVKSFAGVGSFGLATDPAPNTANYPNINQVGDARFGLVKIPASITTDTVTVDYIADWSFLLQDGPPLLAANAAYPALPANPPPPPDVTYQQIALGAPFVEDQAPASVYSLLIDSNLPYRSYFGTTQVDPLPINRLVRANDPQQRESELRSGKVTFIVENSTARARVAYQTRDKWVHQLTVAANTYKPYVANRTEQWRDYYLGDDNFLYFHASEAGKTLSISYRTTNDNGPLVERAFVIDSQILGRPVGVPAAFADSGQVSRVKLTDANGVTLPDNLADPRNLLSIQVVKGVSLTSRTAYINGTKYAQKIDTTTRGAN